MGLISSDLYFRKQSTGYKLSITITWMFHDVKCLAPSWVEVWWPCMAGTLGAWRFREASSSPSTTFRGFESFTSLWLSVMTWPQPTWGEAAQIREYTGQTSRCSLYGVFKFCFCLLRWVWNTDAKQKYERTSHTSRWTSCEFPDVQLFIHYELCIVHVACTCLYQCKWQTLINLVFCLLLTGYQLMETS